MRVELTGGRVVHVGVRHLSSYEGLRSGGRGTRVWIKFGDGTTLEAAAWCSLEDNFCKATGRRLAGIRLLAGLRELPWFSKEDRKRVFGAVCPDLVKA